MHTSIHAYKHTSMHTCMHTHMHACMHICIHTHSQTYRHTDIHTHIYIYSMCTYICLCTHFNLDTLWFAYICILVGHPFQGCFGAWSIRSQAQSSTRPPWCWRLWTAGPRHSGRGRWWCWGLWRWSRRNGRNWDGSGLVKVEKNENKTTSGSWHGTVWNWGGWMTFLLACSWCLAIPLSMFQIKSGGVPTFTTILLGGSWIFNSCMMLLYIFCNSQYVRFA